MRKLTYILLFLTINIHAQYTAIPDSNFEYALVIDGLDDVVDGYVLTANIENVTTLDVTWEFITDLTGIQDFAALDTLDISNNYISSIDLSQNTKLKYFKAEVNYLTSLDFTGNPDIEYINAISQQHVGDYYLESADVSQCTKLVHLDLGNNKLIESIDVSNSPDLEYLDLAASQITSLDLTNNTKLTYLELYRNDMTNLDLSQNTLLEYLNIGEVPLESFDITNNPNIEWLNFGEAMTATEVDLTNNTCLIHLSFGYNGDPYDPDAGITNLDLTNCISLEEVSFWQCNVRTVDLSNCPNLVYFDLGLMYNLQHFSVRNGNNANIWWHKVDDYQWTPDPLYCIEVDDPVKANAMQPPYQYWNFLLNEQYTCSDDCGLGVSESLIDEAIDIYPNPTTSKFSVFNDSGHPIKQLSLYNQLGKQVIHTSLTETIDITDLSRGLYYIKIEMQNGIIINKKIIKK